LDYGLIDTAAAQCGCEVLTDEPMKKHTTFRIGGPADRFATVKTREQLQKLLPALKQGGVPYLILGKGSNLLVSDWGIRGAVLALSGEFQKLELLEDGESIVCGAGVKLADLCKFARDNGLAGMEFAYGIPGTLGGAVFMNAGAYGGEMSFVVRKAQHMTEDGIVGFFSKDELDFSYRHSAYEGKGLVILNAVVKLSHGNPEEIGRKMEELMEKRRQKQPYEMASAGSTFKRPKEAFAAALIEECGLKGKNIGAAAVSHKHAGFIVNQGTASCEDVRRLIETVKKTVLSQKGIELECEVRLVGEGV